MSEREPPQGGVEERLFLIPETADPQAEKPATGSEPSSAGAPTRAELEALRSLPEHLRGFMEAIRDVVAEIATAQETIADQLTAITRRLEQGGDRERVAAAVERLRHQLVAGLTGGFERLQEKLGAVADAGPSWTEEEGLRVLREMAGAERDLEKATRGMRAELERVRKRIESWGRARSSPRMADELGALEERVVDLEGALEGRLTERVAEEVATRLQRVFDRRFEALVQLIDARISTPEEPDDRDRRGRFRRR